MPRLFGQGEVFGVGCVHVREREGGGIPGRSAQRSMGQLPPSVTSVARSVLLQPRAGGNQSAHAFDTLTEMWQDAVDTLRVWQAPPSLHRDFLAEILIAAAAPSAKFSPLFPRRKCIPNGDVAPFLRSMPPSPPGSLFSLLFFFVEENGEWEGRGNRH